MSGAPVKDFIDELRELCGAGSVIVGAVVDDDRMTFDSAGWSQCPFCGTLISAVVIAGTHAKFGGLAGGTYLIVPCEHQALIEDIKAAIVLELESGSMLPERT